MKISGIYRNIIVDIVIQSVLVYRFFNMENIIINNICKIFPLLFSIFALILFFATILFTAASVDYELKNKILNDKTLINGFIDSQKNKPVKIYHKITNCTCSFLLLANGFIGTLCIYLLALLLLYWSKKALMSIINQNIVKPDPHIFEEYKQRLYKETSMN